jgi:hypothetical protein
MTTIIAGGFDHISKAQVAIERLGHAGVSRDNFCEFRVNPAGEHDQTSIGGDHDKSLGAKHAEDGATKGAAIGAAIGTAAGVAATPFVGPAAIVAGAGAGGYAGSLVGSLGGISDEAQPDRTVVRPAEALVAVNVGAGTVKAEEVVRIFEAAGAQQIERAEGKWANGEWADFDPVRAPLLVGGGDSRKDLRPTAGR